MTSDLDLIREAMRARGVAFRISDQLTTVCAAIPAFRRVLLKHLRCTQNLFRACGLCNSCKLIAILKEGEK